MICDNLKIRHKNKLVVEDIIKKLESEFGKMTISTGPHHTYCGMDLSFNPDGSVTVNMT